MRAGLLLGKLALGAIGEGIAASVVLTTSYHHNFWGLLQPDGRGDRLRRWRAGERLPVLFCHGYMGDATNFLILRRRLAAAGFRSQATVWHWPFWRSCEEYAGRIERRLDEVLEATGAPAVDVVAHSMGGLAARRFLALTGRAADVRRLVTLGTPHRGTLVALAGPGRSACDLRPGSPLLRGLDGDLEALPAGKVISIHGALDWIAPPSSAQVPAPQENLRVEGLAHGGLLCSRRVARAVEQALPRVLCRKDALRDPEKEPPASAVERGSLALAGDPRKAR
ncbi:MAG TPA: alpha/beta fold hydrolase [Planctomycetota bacterium]|nr:alpha/beta fold hydrolase [Planctomycetota bacterium]